MNYSAETKYTAEANAFAQARSEDEQKMAAARARCQERETVLGWILNDLSPEELEDLASRKYVYELAMKLWQNAGRPLVGRHREDLLHQLESDALSGAIDVDNFISRRNLKCG